MANTAAEILEVPVDDSVFGFKESADALLRLIAVQGPRHAKPVLDSARQALTARVEKMERLEAMLLHFRGMKRMPICISEAPVAETIQDVLKAMAYEMPMGMATLLKILPRSIKPLAMPRHHLEMIMAQFIDFSASSLCGLSGILTLEASEIQGEGGDKTVRIRISDSGAGLAPQEIPYLFDPLFALEKANRESRLGLCMAKMMLDEYGASVQVQTSPKKTSFILEFPRG